MSTITEDLKALEIINNETVRLYQATIDRQKGKTRVACKLAEHMLDYLIAEDVITAKDTLQYKQKLRELRS